jgi:hypothetical protein
MKQVLLIIVFSFVFLKSTAQLSVYPNPFSVTVTITYSLSSNDTITLEVTDLVGQIKDKIINDSVVSMGTYTINYHPTNLSAGMYFIALITKHEGTTAKKIIYQGSASFIQNISSQNSSLFIYPNPTIKLINVNYTGLKRIEIIDLNCKNIKSVSTSDKTISIEDIKTGEYFINVYSENKLLITEKFLKFE